MSEPKAATARRISSSLMFGHSRVAVFPIPTRETVFEIVAEENPSDSLQTIENMDR